MSPEAHSWRAAGRSPGLLAAEPTHASRGLLSRTCSRYGRGLRRMLGAAITVLLLGLVGLSLYSLRLDDLLPWRTVPVTPLSRAELESLNVPEQPTTGADRRLRVFMSADGPHINLCKTIMSSVALGYPLPTLLNWDGDFNRPEWHFGGSHIAKLESLLAVIEDMLGHDDSVDENDLALLIDAYDIWFQLPPSVLIQRYHQLNREADERNRALWEMRSNQTDFPIAPPRQDIIVTTAKDCFPDDNSGSHPHYEHWPASPMPTDMYGDGTDELLPHSWDPARKYRKMRPRCVNSGMIMGTMGGLRHALRRCQEKIRRVETKGRQVWSDQALFAEVIGDQELWREWVGELQSSWDGTHAYDSSHVSRDARPVANAALAGHRFDFGIGLDYNFTTIPPTCSSEEDGLFVKLADTRALRDASQSAGVPGPVRVRGVPPELQSLDSDVDWANVPLYTDMYFGVTPVGVHHNAYVNGLKPLRLEHWWNKMWFYPRLRELVTQRLQSMSRERPLGTVGEVTYWAPEEDARDASARVHESKDHRFRSIEWDGVCQKEGAKTWYDELFGDEKGQLVV